MRHSEVFSSSVHPVRISHLDGLRGLAILLVFFFHAYARWPDVVPYGSVFAGILLFKYGWLGVELFFLISGFVILMTLERCKNPREFLYRRWNRLFPAMLICSLILFLSAPYFPERPAGMPTPWSLLPALTFSEPYLWSRLLGFDVGHLEGAFWSLCVEVQFYVFAAVFFFWKGRNGLIVAVAFGFALSLIGPHVPYLEKLPGMGSFSFFGWFGSGALFYVYCSSKRRVWVFSATALGSLAAIFLKMGDLGGTLAALVVLAIFAFSCVSKFAQRAFSIRALLFFGYVSYPLYLIHENVLIAGIVKMSKFTESTQRNLTLAFPLVMLAGLGCTAYLIARVAEPRVRGLIKAAISSGSLVPAASGGIKS